MRLLHVKTLEISEFYDDERPKYVIASHRWVAGGEVSFKDVQERRRTDSVGFKKVQGFARYVRERIAPIEWLWIDTCCIDKDSAAELSEAINSMFEWYRSAELCLAYLADIDTTGDQDKFERSEWFKRGWTLQELLAPRIVVFLTKTWQVIGNKGELHHVYSETYCGPGLERRIARVTGIPEDVLYDYTTSSSISFDDRVKWMDGRETTRGEDLSYALFGILGVSPGANYGEKRQGARERLLKEIRQTPDFKSTMFSAATAGNMLTVKKLLRQESELLNACNTSGQTALHLAARAGMVDMVEYLLRNGAKINRDDNNERLPLHGAVMAGSAPVVRALLANGADVDAQDSQGRTPRDICDSSSLVGWFLSHGAELKAEDREGFTPLCRFSYRGNVQAVCTLLDLGADIDAPDRSGQNALYRAIGQDKQEVAKVLLARGANVEARDQRQNTPLIWAGQLGHTRIGELLLNNGADINACNQGGASALHQCCDSGK